MVNIPDFKKIPNKNAKFNQKEFYEDNFEKTKVFAQEVSAQLAEKANKAQEAWITPTLLNGWTANVVPTLSPKYYKDTLGIVHLKGVTENGVSGGAAFVLPVGYRSAGTLRFACASRAGINSVFSVDIKSNGEVAISRDTTLDRWVDLSAISFRAEG